MILPFSGFFTIMRNALSTRYHQAKNSRLSTLVAKVTFGQLILFQTSNKFLITFSSNFSFIVLDAIKKSLQREKPVLGS